MDKREVAKATVTLPKLGGQGVLVNGNLIITAAHCIDFKRDGNRAPGRHQPGSYVEDIKTARGEFKVALVAADPISDVAVFGALDGQGTRELFEKKVHFEMFCEGTKPVPLCLSDFQPFQSFPVQIFTHIGIWVTGSATQCPEDVHILWVEADRPIDCSSSGGPIINEQGELVGIVSDFCMATSGQDKSKGPVPRPHLTLPVWVCRRIISAKHEGVSSGSLLILRWRPE
jgi:hypothetical protein